MLRTNSRRRPRDGAHLCAAASAATLLLLSLFVLHSRLSSSPLRFGLGLPSDPIDADLLLDDAENDAFDNGADDRIDVFDDVEEEDGQGRKGVSGSDDDDDSDADDAADGTVTSGGYFWDHALGVKRRAFGRRQALDQQRDDGLNTLDDEEEEVGDRSKVAFASDDLPVDGDIRVKMDAIRGVEDALLIKVVGGGGNSPLRGGWSKWFETKGRFLRQDRLFGSSMELLNPMNHPLLQDPDIPGVTTLTRGDKLLQKAMWKEMQKTPFAVGNAIKRVERRSLNMERKQESDGRPSKRKTASKEGHIYPDGRRWGYYPELAPHLSFSEFMNKFLGSGKCPIRVFMVWNSPPWAFGVRHLRGLESLLHHHRDACVVVFSETMELDFFRDFVDDGFRIAVAMPNLDELLKDTPVSVFASVWSEWRKTKYYSIHYSELVRLAALYRYGGIYLDSDVIVLKSLESLQNSYGIEEKAAGNLTFNGAVMAFKKHSPFIMECMKEFYSTYDDTSLRWNGAELLGRVTSGWKETNMKLDLKIEEPHVFFPIDSSNISRYFVAPVDDITISQQEILLRRILDNSTTFHFWNGVTSALVPEPGSLVERLMNRYCLRCLDVL